MHTFQATGARVQIRNWTLIKGWRGTKREGGGASEVLLLRNGGGVGGRKGFGPAFFFHFVGPLPILNCKSLILVNDIVKTLLKTLFFSPHQR